MLQTGRTALMWELLPHGER